MKEPKHTPGPWETFGCVDNYQKIGIRAAGGQVGGYRIAYTAGGLAQDQGMREANACLIAAAPQLYEALERLRAIARCVTVRQVIEAGDEAIEAAGLNPWCINEGLAEGHERLDLGWVDAALAAAKVQP